MVVAHFVEGAARARARGLRVEQPACELALQE
jgi:hypothetical protein